MRQVVRARWAAVAAVGLIGIACKSGSPTVIDVTVAVDGTLALDTVTVSASAPGKADFHKDLAAAATVRISIEPASLASGTVVTIEARGMKGTTATVIDRARAALAAGRRVAVSLHLAADCAGVLSCTADQTCLHGSCVALTPPTTDGGTTDGGTNGDGATDRGTTDGGASETPIQCQDGMKNGNETDVDCGGSACPRCQRDKACAADGDCLTGSCKRFFCALVSGPPNWLPGPPLNMGRGDMPIGMQRFANRQALLLAIGGRDDGNPDVATTYEVLDTSQSTPAWAAPVSLPSGGLSDNPAATDGAGRILAFSSYGTWSYTGNSGWITSLTIMPSMRDATAAGTGANGLVYVVGGSTAGAFGAPVATVEAYDSAMNKWTTNLAPMATGRSFLAAAAGLDQRIYAIGGSAQPATGGVMIVGTVEAYDVANNAWTKVAEIPDATQELAAVGGPDGRIYALGGRTASALLATVNAYSPASDRWAPVAPLSGGRFGLGATVTPDGRIWAVGGLTSFVSPLTTVEIYGPVVAVNPQSAAAGESAAVTGSNFAADADVHVYIGTTAGTALATGHTNGAGALVAPINFTVPNLTSGDQALIVMDDRSQYPITLLFRIR